MPEKPQEINNNTQPEPEVLEVRSEIKSSTTTSDPDTKIEKTQDIKRQLSHLPSHRGTLMGLIVVIVVIVVNVAIVVFIVKSQEEQKKEEERSSVMISDEVLSGLGVSRNPVGGADTLLTIGPNTVFKGKATISGDTTISGRLVLNNTFTATDASFSKLQAGDTQVQQLNVNGDATTSNLNLRKDLQVAGLARIQGPLTVNQLTTINNNLNVAGNVSIGGALSVRNFQVGQLTVGGHLLSTGSVPGVSAGGAVGNNGTVSISGNDTAGTVAVNAGTGAGNGMLAQVSFKQRYANTPRIVITPVGRAVPGLYVNRTANGFSINVEGSMSYGGFAFDYVVVQ